MGLVCSGRCGQDAVGPEPAAHTPTARRTKDKVAAAAASAPHTPNDTADNPEQGVRGEGSGSSGRKHSTEDPAAMPSRTLLVGAEDPDSDQGVGALGLAVNGRNKMNHDLPLTAEDMTGEAVGQYLKAHPEFLESWLMEQVELETLERWMIRRTQRDKQKSLENGTNAAPAILVSSSLSFDSNATTTNTTTTSATTTTTAASNRASLERVASKIIRKTSLSRWKFCVHADKRKMLQELTSSLYVRPNKPHVLWELTRCISSAVNADGCNLYLADLDTNTLMRYVESKDGEGNTSTWTCPVGSGSWLCGYVASSRQATRVTCPTTDPRFPKGCASAEEQDVHHLLVMAVVQSDGELAAVLELYRRRGGGEAFHTEDEEIVNSYLVWGGIALHYAELYHSMVKQRTLNEFILSVVKSIFQDMVSMDTLIMKVMNFAQKLVNADRASLFLVDSKNKQLYARIFDMGSEFTEENPPQSQSFKEIRFAIGKGIAGIVAQNGEVLNIPDAYADPRFNRTVDQLTGYVTKSILCMPIFIRGNVIGVMQMVNKASGVFNKEDEESFQMFAIYCGLALHHAKLYDKIRRSEQKYKVALEVLSYHNSCSDDELDALQAENVTKPIPGVDDYYFCAMNLEDMTKVRHAIYMFVDLFGLSRFDKDCLIRFTLTVKKNYRRVPYHNWTHGFSVANSMYAIIKHNPKSFRPLECLSLFIGSLCHDLDHRGKNNKFMLETESPLAAIYTTSTLEHHHFNQTVTILQQEGHNIFGKLTSTEYKQVLGNIKHCILATDLALFFPNKARLTQLVEDNLFDWDNYDHRMLIEAIAMTACDLCASAKPWEMQAETVKVIFEEFYEQGDAEKAAGKNPIPMMDRTKVNEQAESQVGFLSGICIPCYELLHRLIPNTEPLLDGCKNNLQTWKKIAEEKRKVMKSNSEVEGEEETDTGIEEVNEEEEEEEEGVEALQDIDDECVDGKSGT